VDFSQPEDQLALVTRLVTVAGCQLGSPSFITTGDGYSGANGIATAIGSNKLDCQVMPVLFCLVR
jgi:hypothetical protein